MTDKQTELLRCPFCGGTANVERTSYGTFYISHNSALECGIDGFGSYLTTSQDTDAMYDTQEEAIKAWNTRHQDKLNEGLVKLIDEYGGKSFNSGVISESNNGSYYDNNEHRIAEEERAVAWNKIINYLQPPRTKD